MLAGESALLNVYMKSMGTKTRLSSTSSKISSFDRHKTIENKMDNSQAWGIGNVLFEISIM